VFDGHDSLPETVMTGMKKVRLLGVLAIMSVTAASRGDALGRQEWMFCSHACYLGLGTVCPDLGDLEAMCNEDGCSVAGCESAWGNCQDGFIVQCNEPM
jgi:hypothetical protein